MSLGSIEKNIRAYAPESVLVLQRKGEPVWSYEDEKGKKMWVYFPESMTSSEMQSVLEQLRPLKGSSGLRELISTLTSQKQILMIEDN